TSAAVRMPLCFGGADGQALREVRRHVNLRLELTARPREAAAALRGDGLSDGLGLGEAPRAGRLPRARYARVESARPGAARDLDRRRRRSARLHAGPLEQYGEADAIRLGAGRARRVA